jgi:hypothetical protein
VHCYRNCAIAAKAGYPSVMVPGGFISGSDGKNTPDYPLGVTFADRAWSERELLRLAYAFEQASQMRKPPPGLLAEHMRSVDAALPAQQPLRHHVERMAQLYQLDRVERRAPALPAHDLCLTVARQCGKLTAIHVGSGHRARQSLADPLLPGDVVLP